ncbi:unnamed protein product, partial [Ectocarpus sp. 13 AM-2016]
LRCAWPPLATADLARLSGCVIPTSCLERENKKRGIRVIVSSAAIRAIGCTLFGQKVSRLRSAEHDAAAASTQLTGTMAASVKIEFDDGSRVISQTLEDSAEVVDPRIAGGGVLSVGKRPTSCSIDDFYEIPRTTSFIADGNFRRVALQFPDALLREAPEVLWTLQARLRKLVAGGVRSVSQEGREAEGEGQGGSSEVGTTV